METPEHISKAAQKWWKQIEGDFVLDHHQILILTEAAVAWDRAQEARKEIEKTGVLVEDRYGKQVASPAVAIELNSRTSFARLMRELSLDVGAPETRPPYLRSYVG